MEMIGDQSSTKPAMTGKTATEVNGKFELNNGQVGFDALPEQLVNRAVQTGFCFNVLCVGEPGIGKTTLMESLFSVDLHTPAPVELKDHNGLCFSSHLLMEGNVKLRLGLIETSGYGDQVDKRSCYQCIIDFIDKQFQRTLNSELKIDRRNQPLDAPMLDDTCVHVCLYFIEPTGHSLKALDLVSLRCLDARINIVPVIAKSDTLSKNELAKMKERVREELSGFRIYKWPTDDENVAPLNTQMNQAMPLAVVGSAEFVKIANKQVRGRQYPWGVVQVENENHCDFVRLRDMLIRTNMLDLIATTHTVHYELFRHNRMVQLGIKDLPIDGDMNGTDPKQPSSPLELFQHRLISLRFEWEEKERELKDAFIEKVKQKENDLKAIEKDINNELSDAKQWYRENREVLEERLNDLNNEIAAIESHRKSQKHSGRKKR